ncbi:cadmium-induced protein AS8 isoform X2 [Neltuma alba]|uniref:cadmium-induced protein AS8 isoform X1 n=2 Tax=Neltuma alba TaxID=207710 RepID=UPI0010A3EA6F|nr:cadmium-induced protein AS8-like isoform X1 [Prosopis alba]XP_028759461.1 cadmium-induced protein AS8-like isoform X2 [Prosopis alba]
MVFFFLVYLCSQVIMIIKGLFGRCERWNPVHPTYGTFWGMGVGIGCGVGWGPGFGPEVVGYVGAGCGVGFSVGITLAGFGIGLPMNFCQAPYQGRGSALESAHFNGFLSGKHVAEDSWSGIVRGVSYLQREATEKLSSFRQRQLLIKGKD